MEKITNLLFAVLLVATTAMNGQTLTGTVVDSGNEPLPGADIVVVGTTKGASTDFDGKFSFDVDAGNGTVKVSFIGFNDVTLNFTVATGEITDLGTIQLTESAESLNEIVVVGTGVIDLAEDRATPVAVSTIMASEIQKKIGTQDVTMTLVNTPSVYVSGQSGGFGDSRIAVRGFEQDNTAYLLNGQPINGMEDGKMYWSNWSGINDIASAIQIQRGLGSSKLAISSVGGTVNFVTRTTDKKEGGFASMAIANNNYVKLGAGYSTGKSEKGFGMTVMLSHWEGDGYNEGNFGQGQTYFISFGYTPNDKHNFNFLITGAPQYHDQNFSKSISSYLEYGRKYNTNWGTYNGEYMTERRNFYHKPVANLNWDFIINETTNLSTVLYSSWGRGGGTGNRGTRIRTDEGRIDYDAIYAFNNSVPSGEGGYFAAGGGYVTRSSVNSHSWYGIVSNLEKTLNEYLTLNVGIDYRYYYGYHHRVVENFHGLTSWQENIRLRDQNNNHETYGSFGTYKNVITTQSYDASPWKALTNVADEDEKIAYSNDERITYGGLFAQLEYAKDDFSMFFQGSLSNQKHQRFDYYQYADQSLIGGTSSQGTGTPLPSNITDGVDSKKVSNIGFNVKGGGSYATSDNSRFYVNAGYYSRQPYHDNIYLNFTNQINPLTQNEKILGLEAGYSYNNNNFSANVNLYRTSWKDRVVTSSDVVDDVVEFTTNEGTEQLHNGIELDMITRAITNLTLKGFISIGNWEYKGDVITRTTDEDQNVISTETEDVDGGKVGDAAQFTVGAGFDFKIVDRLYFDSDYRFYDNLYADVGAIKKNLKLPSYGIMDSGISYQVLLGNEKTKSIRFRFNVNNVFNTIYLSELSTAIETEPGDETYNGIAVNNRGYFGLGRTWNVSARFNF